MPRVRSSTLMPGTDIVMARLPKIHSEGWATRGEVEAFTATANSRHVLGREARHGHRKWQPAPNPITFEEARELVHRIVSAWLRSKDGAGATMG